MAIEYTWSVSSLKRNVADGGVTVAHWRCAANETVGTGDDAVEYFAEVYDQCNLEYNASASDFIAYESLTEANVLSWVHAIVGKSDIESLLSDKIDRQKNPVSASGKPW